MRRETFIIELRNRLDHDIWSGDWVWNKKQGLQIGTDPTCSQSTGTISIYTFKHLLGVTECIWAYLVCNDICSISQSHQPTPPHFIVFCMHFHLTELHPRSWASASPAPGPSPPSAPVTAPWPVRWSLRVFQKSLLQECMSSLVVHVTLLSQHLFSALNRKATHKWATMKPAGKLYTVILLFT